MNLHRATSEGFFTDILLGASYEAAFVKPVRFALGLFRPTCTDDSHVLSRVSLLSLALPPLCRLRRERHDRTAPTEARGVALLRDGRTHPKEVWPSCTATRSAQKRSGGWRQSAARRYRCWQDRTSYDE